MSSKRVLARNALWQWGGVIVTMLSGVVVSPFLVRTLGKSGYGLWLLLVQVSAYFGLLDLGVRQAVGRYVAFYRGKDDQENVNVTISTAVVYMLFAAMLSLVVTFTILPYYLVPLKIAPEQMRDAQLSLMYVGLNLTAVLAFSLVDTTLWGFQRFDIINGVDILVAVLRILLMFYFLGHGYGIVALAQVTFFMTLLIALIKGLACFWIEPRLRVGLKYVKRSSAEQLFGYGKWTLVNAIANMSSQQLSTYLIAKAMNVAVIAPYGTAKTLIGYGTNLVSNGTTVLTPYAAGLSVGGKGDAQVRLFIVGGRLCLAFTLFITYNFLLLGRALIQIWQKPEMWDAIPIVYISMIGETLAVSQLVSIAIMYGQGKPRTIAIINMCDAVFVLASTYFLAPYGILWVCVGIGVSATLTRGLGTLLCVCAVLEVPVTTYVMKAIIPPIVATAIPGLILALAVNRHTPSSWSELFLYGGCFTLIYACGCVYLIGFDQVRSLVRSARAKFTKAEPIQE